MPRVLHDSASLQWQSGAQSSNSISANISGYTVMTFLYRNNEDSLNNLMYGVQLADVSTRCSSHPQGISEARCENAGAL